MEKFFNSFCVFSSFIGGIFLKLVGGWDILIAALLVLMFFDYITGILKGFFLKNLNSKIGFWGIISKIIILIIISTSYIINNTINPSLPLRETVILFFISNEGLSILENAAIFIPIPEQLKEAIYQLRNTKDNLKK